ncbi:MAG TPA: zinc-binding dehydrogenase [Candidatus Acidoferrum sp.]|nr:zinc-binding dehydrogenase [Candidatus Acidoferrum sp.]
MPFVLPGVVPIPAKNSFEEGALLEPVNTVLKAVKRLALLPGDTVMVIGQGPVGLMFTALLKLSCVNVLAVDLIPQRLPVARHFGAKWTITPPELDQWLSTGRRSIDAAVVTAPSDAAVRDCHSRVRGGGQVLVFAHTTPGAMAELDLSLVCVQERDLIGSYSADFTLQAAVADLVFARRLDVRRLISHRFRLEQAPSAIDLAANPTPTSLKICVCPADEPLVTHKRAAGRDQENAGD